MVYDQALFLRLLNKFGRVLYEKGRILSRPVRREAEA